MVKKPKGWTKHPHEHRMARYGIETRSKPYVFRADGVQHKIHHGNRDEWLIAHEVGELDDQQTLILFSYLLQTDQAFELEGDYHKIAAKLVKEGYLDSDGNILVDPEELEASGLPLEVLPHFRDMYEEEIEGAKHYKEMAERFPDYGWVFEKMAADEKRHAELVKQMERGEDIDMRNILKDDVSDVLNVMEESGRIAPLNKKKLEKAADKVIDNMEVQKLKASGLETALIYGMLSAFGKKIGSSMFDGAAKK